jgi:hypothetical protein
MRIYVIRRSSRGIVRCMVTQEAKPGQRVGLPYQLPHANLHSPTGFECGYGGSGPADLAASILADFFNVHVRTVGAAWRGKHSRKPRPDADRIVQLHQDFKAEIISRIELGKREEHRITGDQIAEWLCKKDNEAKADAEAVLEDPNKMPEIETDPE